MGFRACVDRGRAWLGAALAVCSGSVWAGDWDYTIIYNDPTGQSQSFYAQIDAHIGAALASWGQYFQGDAHFDVLVTFSSGVAGATGASAASALVGNNGTHDIFEQGAAYEVRTGIDPNGAAPDIVLQINPEYLRNELWFDPDPYARTAAVAGDRTDAESVFIHEIGHALAFNGWREVSGYPNSSYGSTWDEQVSFLAGALYFTGEGATSVYGAPVPVTFGRDYHIGNEVGPGRDLQGDVMNGIALQEGQRYFVSELNVAMLSDMGLSALAPVSPAPEPATVGLMLTGLLGMAGMRYRRKPRAGAR
jgi:hypothetical protein